MPGFDRRLVMAGALMALVGAVPVPAPVSTGPRVTGFSAYLLNSTTGALSADMMRSPNQLGNVPAGPFASVSTLVVVRIAFGPGGALPERNARVRLVATTPTTARGAARRVLADRSARLGPVAPDGTTYVGFWLDDTGCAVVSLRATLTTGRTSATGTSELPFSCYE